VAGGATWRRCNTVATWPASVGVSIGSRYDAGDFRTFGQESDAKWLLQRTG